MTMYQVFLGPQKSYERIPECLPKKSTSYKPPFGDSPESELQFQAP